MEFIRPGIPFHLPRSREERKTDIKRLSLDGLLDRFEKTCVEMRKLEKFDLAQAEKTMSKSAGTTNDQFRENFKSYIEACKARSKYEELKFDYDVCLEVFKEKADWVKEE